MRTLLAAFVAMGSICYQIRKHLRNRSQKKNSKFHSMANCSWTKTDLCVKGRLEGRAVVGMA